MPRILTSTVTMRSCGEFTEALSTSFCVNGTAGATCSNLLHCYPISKMIQAGFPVTIFFLRTAPLGHHVPIMHTAFGAYFFIVRMIKAKFMVLGQATSPSC